MQMQVNWVQPTMFNVRRGSGLKWLRFTSSLTACFCKSGKLDVSIGASFDLALRLIRSVLIIPYPMVSIARVMLKFNVACAMTTCFFKAGELEIPATGFDPVSSELWAPRAYLCAMPVMCCSSLMSLALWQPASVKLANARIPPGGFDPPTSGLWVLRSASELRRCYALRLTSS